VVRPRVKVTVMPKEGRKELYKTIDERRPGPADYTFSKEEKRTSYHYWEPGKRETWF